MNISDRPPFFTYEELDRSMYEYIRIGLVRAGLLPDISLYTTAASYKAAKDSLRASLAGSNKRLVELFGVANMDARDGKTDAKITIDRMGTPIGSMGAFGAYYYSSDNALNPTLYNIYGYPDRAIDIVYDVRIISRTTEMERIAHHVVYRNLGVNRYHLSYHPITYVKSVDKYFLLELAVDTNLSTSGMLEILMKYVVRDVFIADGDISDGGYITSADQGFLLDGHTREPVLSGDAVRQIVPMSTVRFYITPTSDMTNLESPDSATDFFDIPSPQIIIPVVMVWSAWSRSWSSQSGAWSTQRYQ